MLYPLSYERSGLSIQCPARWPCRIGLQPLDAGMDAAPAINRAGFVPVPIIAARRLRSEDMLGEYLAALRAADASESGLVMAGDPAELEGPLHGRGYRDRLPRH
jgi:hypothetical protein